MFYEAGLFWLFWQKQACVGTRALSKYCSYDLQHNHQSPPGFILDGYLLRLSFLAPQILSALASSTNTGFTGVWYKQLRTGEFCMPLVFPVRADIGWFLIRSLWLLTWSIFLIKCSFLIRFIWCKRSLAQRKRWANMMEVYFCLFHSRCPRPFHK